MNRRDFLKLGGAASAILVLPIGLIAKGMDSLATAELNGTIYRGTSDGKVLRSSDEGKNWSQVTDFGAGFNVFSLSAVQRDRIYARLGYAGKDFGLVYSPAEHTWRTN